MTVRRLGFALLFTFTVAGTGCDDELPPDDCPECGPDATTPPEDAGPVADGGDPGMDSGICVPSDESL